MNDFTKEELQNLDDGLSWMLDQDNFCCVTTLNHLRNKIQSMIDNYCEHKQYHYYADVAAGECTECGMVMLP